MPQSLLYRPVIVEGEGFRYGASVLDRTDAHKRGLGMRQDRDDFSIAVVSDGRLVVVLDAYFRLTEEVSEAWTTRLLGALGNKIGSPWLPEIENPNYDHVLKVATRQGRHQDDALVDAGAGSNRATNWWEEQR